MASYFGEVVETFSRAFYSDCDDLDGDSIDITRDYKLSWISGDVPSAADLFIIVDGKCSRGFFECFRSKAEVVGKIEQIYEKDKNEKPVSWKKRESPSNLYKLKEGVYLCEVSLDIKVMSANYFVSKLYDLLKKSKEVIILTSLNSYRYISKRAHTAPFLKALANSTFKSRGRALLVPAMDPPNIISGVPASVLTFCEVQKIIASLYVCYCPEEEIDSAIFGELHKLFSQLQEVKTIVEDLNFKSKETIFNSRTGNLYM